ncbi:unnamed protein product [Pleuronectes platessa]|uniref:Cytochrome c oxidase subunit 7C, mitochondrial n=1 Tax=Pleuronectes platessa TaxID=8262 RepID=A0A9N7TUJ1_PLEPL|nr:unnamed protein product [Pleuronectes platessa]
MLGQAVRRFTTSAVRSSHYGEGPGKNLPFSTPDPEEVKWPSPVILPTRSSPGTYLSIKSSVPAEEWESLIFLCK